MNILITREEEKASAFAEKLSAVGLTPFSLPMIECVPVSAIISGSYDYGIFTSPNAAKYFVPYTKRVKIDNVTAVGPATAEALLEIGLSADMIPDEYSSEGMKNLFADIDVRGKKFIFPGAAVRAGDFHEFLKSEGAEVDVVTTYRTSPIEYGKGYIEKFLTDNSINLVTFASPSAAKAMLGNIDDMTQQIVCIGKTTADAVNELGYACRYPDDFSLDWMIKLIQELS